MHISTALFSDRSVSQNNEISTGEFDVRISKDGSKFYDDLKLFDFNNLKPGDSRDVVFYIKNGGDVDISTLRLDFDVQDLEKGSLTDAESLVDNTTDVGELSQNLLIRDFEITKGNQTYSLTDYIGKNLKDVSSSAISILNEKLMPRETLKVKLSLQLSPSAGNECQTDTAKISINIYAEQ